MNIKDLKEMARNEELYRLAKEAMDMLPSILRSDAEVAARDLALAVLREHAPGDGMIEPVKIGDKVRTQLAGEDFVGRVTTYL